LSLHAPPTHHSPLSLHDALPISTAARELDAHVEDLAFHRGLEAVWRALDHANKYVVETAPFTLAKDPARRPRVGAILHELCEARSEEHTSELQSRGHLVCRLLLE